jgi:radical SAM protein with 4Fe4S-binding SPASM domain
VDAIQDARWKDIVRLTQYRWLDVQSPPYFGRNYSRCRAPWLISAIGAEGKVWPCSEMAGVEGEELGDLHDKSFGEIFTKPNIEAFIARKNPKTCRRICKGHETNKALHHIYHIEKESHPNHL